MDESGLSAAAAYIADILSAGRSHEQPVEIFTEKDSFFGRLTPEEFRPLPGEEGARGTAIDGGSRTLLDGHTFIVSARRVGAVGGDHRGAERTLRRDMQVEALDRHRHREVFARRYREVAGEDPPGLPDSPEETADGLRALEEHALAGSLLEEMEEGDLLMMDGALTGDPLLEPLIGDHCRRAARRGVHLVGVCKRSDLYTGRLPVLSWITRQGDRVQEGQRWYYPLSGERRIYVAKLHPAARFAFRIDVNPREEEPRCVLSLLTALADEVSCLGYPYLLALAHREASISGEEGRLLRDQVREQVLRQGWSLEDWERVFFDYHRYME
ncbi:MAG: DNA double-strand break repair nuclease NurA [Candidatus Thermoplasmatota archaeon]|nr:DNA double-strand break repair nuclease NurA [Candidatus Thermoplasmatota archaeon]